MKTAGRTIRCFVRRTDPPAPSAFSASLASRAIAGRQLSVQYLHQVFAAQGPFDGVWGFGQGETTTHT